MRNSNSTNPLVDKALDYAVTKHQGKDNKYSGEPYVLHVLRVFRNVRDAGYGTEHQITALLHDTVEDTDATVEEIHEAFGGTVAAAVDSLTKQKGQTLEQYYTRVQLNKIATVVKFYDLMDNFKRNHLIDDEATRLRMAKKYSLGFDMLSDYL